MTDDERAVWEHLKRPYPVGAYGRWQRNGDALDAERLQDYDESLHRAIDAFIRMTTPKENP